jgi:hypothetical protein
MDKEVQILDIIGDGPVEWIFVGTNSEDAHEPTVLMVKCNDAYEEAEKIALEYLGFSDTIETDVYVEHLEYKLYKREE